MIDRLRRGDASAFECLVRNYGGRMHCVARRFLVNDEDAADVVQDALLNAFRAAASFAGDAKLSTWLHRIVVNSSLMFLRSRRRHPLVSIEELLPRYQDDGHQVASSDCWNSPLKAVEARETALLVRKAIDQLPDGYREILLMRDIEELDTDETAKLLELSVGAVKVRLHRASQALRTLLDQHFRGTPA
jgi:RNA polymerase sigma-70 factor (ECF subfamily)